MSRKTLDYDSVGRWMSLAVWAAGAYECWDADRELLGHPKDDAWYTSVFHSIAQEALNRGFSLRSGHRKYAVFDMLKAIAPHDTDMHTAFLRIDKESWLTPVGARSTRERKQVHGLQH